MCEALMKQYKTVKNPATVEYKEKNSKFIAHVIPCEEEEQAIGFLEDKRKVFWDATHNVYAYVLRQNNIQRYSDDGEPSGTGGLPMLDVLLREQVTNVAVVVTRYFGGTLLGTGGLVRAYSKGVILGLEQAGIVKKELYDLYKLQFDYEFIGKLQYEVNSINGIVKETVYQHNVEIYCYIPEDFSVKFEKNIVNATNARLIFAKLGSEYISNS